jgi:hypothetical protein
VIQQLPPWAYCDIAFNFFSPRLGITCTYSMSYWERYFELVFAFLLKKFAKKLEVWAMLFDEKEEFKILLLSPEFRFFFGFCALIAANGRSFTLSIFLDGFGFFFLQ